MCPKQTLTFHSCSPFEQACPWYTDPKMFPFQLHGKNRKKYLQGRVLISVHDSLLLFSALIAMNIPVSGQQANKYPPGEETRRRHQREGMHRQECD